LPVLKLARVAANQDFQAGGKVPDRASFCVIAIRFSPLSKGFFHAYNVTFRGGPQTEQRKDRNPRRAGEADHPGGERFVPPEKGDLGHSFSDLPVGCAAENPAVFDVPPEGSCEGQRSVAWQRDLPLNIRRLKLPQPGDEMVETEIALTVPGGPQPAQMQFRMDLE